MPGFIGNAIATGQGRLEGYRAAAAAAMTAPNPVVVAAASAGMLGYSQRLAKHTEQYKHYCGWPYTAINRIATRLSAQPCRVGRKVVTPARGRKMTRQMFDRAPDYVKAMSDDYEILPAHYLLDTLARPNDIPHFVTASLFYVTVASLELTGKAFWWMPRRNGKIQIWHFPTDWVTPKHAEGRLYAYFEVRAPNRMAAPEDIPAEEMVCFALPDPSDPHGSVSPGQTQAPAIAADEAIQMSQVRGFENGLHPGLMLTVGRHPDVQGKPGVRPHLTRPQRKDLIEAVRSICEGAVNYGEPLILDGMIEKAEKFTNTIQEMDYLDSGRQTKSRIMQAYGVNPIVAGENIAIGWAQASAADGIFVQNTVNPISVLLGQSVTRHLWESGERDVVFWIEEAVPHDPELKTKRYVMGLTKGACTVDEYRHEILHLPPLEEGGDERLPQKPPGVPPKPPIDEEEERLEQEDEPEGARPRPGAKHAIPEKLMRMADSLRTRQLDVHGADIEEVMNRFFRGVAKRVGMETRRVQADAPELFSETGASTVRTMVYNENDWLKPLREAAHEPLVRAAVTGYFAAKALMQERLRSIKGWAENPPTAEELELILSWELPAEVAAGITEAIGETLEQKYWTKILETVGEDIEHTIQRAAKEGWSQYKTTKALVEQVGDPKRAKRIANTESTNSLNAGHTEQAKEMERAGLHAIKIWNTIMDMVTREEHADMNGIEVKGAAGLFLVDGYEVPWPGHYSLPARLRCECILPGNMVQGSFVAGTKSWYEGKAVEIVTASGRRMTITPKHPVLTEHGLIAAGSLQQGDEIIAYDGQVNFPPDADEVDHAPIPVEQVFDSLGLRCGVAKSHVIERCRALPTDFHGDGQGIQGEVEIIRPNRKLIHRRDPMLKQEFLDGEFCGIDTGLVAEPPKGFSDKARRDIFQRCNWLGIRVNSAGIPCTGALTDNGGPVAFESGPFQPFRIGSAAYWNITLSESAKKHRPTVARFVRELLERFSSDVAFGEGVQIRDRLAVPVSPSDRDTCLAEMVLQDAPVDTRPLGNTIQGFACKIFLDQIVKVRDFQFRGHVYDLQSESGLIITENIALGNCRCGYFTDLQELRAA